RHRGDAPGPGRYGTVQIGDDPPDVGAVGCRQPAPARPPAAEPDAADAEPHRSAESTGDVVTPAEAIGDERADYDQAQAQDQAEDAANERVEDQVLEAWGRKRGGGVKHHAPGHLRRGESLAVRPGAIDGLLKLLQRAVRLVLLRPQVAELDSARG